MQLAVRPPAGEIHLDYDDYAALPSDGRRYEVIEGDLFVSPAPRPRHQKAIVNLCGILLDYLRDRPIGDIYLAPIDVILSLANVVQPDLLFLRKERFQWISDRGIEGPPDLIVEVLSPTTEKTDRGAKSALYAKFGVAHYWLIDPAEERLEIFSLAGGRYRPVSPPLQAPAQASFDGLFPGLVFDVAALWK